MKLKNILQGAWGKATLNKKIKEASEALKIDFKEDLTNGQIQTGLLFLSEKSRGKAKVIIDDAIDKIMKNDVDPSWEVVEKQNKEEEFTQPKTTEEQEKSDRETILSILEEMNVLIAEKKQKQKDKKQK